MSVETCPACAEPVPRGARFCPACGRALAVGDAAERKLATVLFADIAGSSELAQSIDAEQLRTMLGDVYDQLSWVIAAYGGTVEKFIGDAVMAVFGVPRAHEDDPERAVRAALVMRSRAGSAAARSGLEVVLRIGINTGLVVTGTNPGRDFLVTGDAVNLAARLQQAAEPGEILVGDRTYRAVEPVVRTVAPRSLRVKGRTGPVVAYAVEGLAPASLYRRRRRPYGPFVGRSTELMLIRSLVERAVEHRRPQLVTVVGEPGIGKTRLVEEVVVDLQRGQDPPAVWVLRCLPYGEAGPYAPLRELLGRAAAVTAADSREEALSKVRGQLLAVLGDDADDVVEELLRLAGPGAAADGDGDGDDERDGGRSPEAWRELLLAMARRRPTLLVIEDAHWAEDALLELVAEVVRTATRVPLAVICVARDELLAGRRGWVSGARNESTITLDALGDDDMQRLALALAATGEPPAEAIGMAGGNPFFLEEILAMAGEGSMAMVPDTVQGVIAARLDLLPGEEKRLLQRAAVAGRSFDLETLAAVGDDEHVPRRLRSLAERDLVVPAGQSRYGFKHALIRDVAYESIPRSERARLHLRLAQHVNEQGAGRQVVANHYAAAANLGMSEVRGVAVERLLEAAAEARSVYAYGSAMSHASRAVALAEDDPERALALEAVGDAQWMAELPDDAWSSYQQALDHAERSDLDRAVLARLRWKYVDLPTRWGAGTPVTRAELVPEPLEQGLRDAEALGDRALEARFLIARALLSWVGDDDQACVAGLEDAREAGRISAQLDRPPIQSAALDAEGALLVRLGLPGDAREAAERRFALLPRLTRREEQMDAFTMTAGARIGTGDYRGALEATETAAALASDGAEHWTAWPLQQRMEAYFWWDRWDDALEAYGEFLRVYRSTGRNRGTPPIRATGIPVAIHLLRGDRELAEVLEQRSGAVDGWRTVAVSHALLGCDEPALALEKLPTAYVKHGSRLSAVAVSAEAAAMLGDWDRLDELLAQAREMPGFEQSPRLSAQLDRARGISGDELALQRAADAFDALGCRFEHARCLELQGHAARARQVFEALGAEPALHRLAR